MPILPLSCFRDTGVDHIVSLGRACETAYNLRRHFGFATAYPFDWWISSTAGVARFIRQADVADLYREDDLRPSGNAESILNARYDIRLHHEFPRDRQAKGQPVIAGWAGHIAAPRDRTGYLARRFFGLAGTARSIVFMRMFGPRDTNAAAVVDLLDALHDRFPATPFSVVLVNFRGTMPDGCQADRLAVSGPPGSDWRGHAGTWDTALGTLGLRLAAGLHAPAAPRDLSPHLGSQSAHVETTTRDA